MVNGGWKDKQNLDTKKPKFRQRRKHLLYLHDYNLINHVEFILLELLDCLNTSENLDSDYWLYLEWDLESVSDDNVENANSGFKNVKSNRGNADQSFVSFLAKFNSILDLHAPLKKISKQKLKFRNKPWITLGLQN